MNFKKTILLLFLLIFILLFSFIVIYNVYVNGIFSIDIFKSSSSHSQPTDITIQTTSPDKEPQVIEDYYSYNLFELYNVTENGVRVTIPNINDPELQSKDDHESFRKYRRGPDSFIETSVGSLFPMSISSIVISIDDEARTVSLSYLDGTYPRELIIPRDVPIHMATYEPQGGNTLETVLPPRQVLTQISFEEIGLGSLLTAHIPSIRYPNGFVFTDPIK